MTRRNHKPPPSPSAADALLTLFRAYRAAESEQPSGRPSLDALIRPGRAIRKHLADGADSVLREALDRCVSLDEHGELLRVIHAAIEDRAVSPIARCEMFCIPLVVMTPQANPVPPDVLDPVLSALAKTAREAGLLRDDQTVLLLNGLRSADDILALPFSRLAKAPMLAFQKLTDVARASGATHTPEILPAPQEKLPGDGSGAILSDRFLVGFAMSPVGAPSLLAPDVGAKASEAFVEKLVDWTDRIERLVTEVLPDDLITVLPPQSLHRGLLAGLRAQREAKLRIGAALAMEARKLRPRDIHLVASFHSDDENHAFAQIGAFSSMDGALVSGVRVPIEDWVLVEGVNSAFEAVESMLDSCGDFSDGHPVLLPGTQMNDTCPGCGESLFLDAQARWCHVPDETHAPMADVVGANDILLDDEFWRNATAH